MSWDYNSETLAPRILSEDVVKSVLNRLENLCSDTGGLDARVVGWWSGELRWARNRVSLSSDRRDVVVVVRRTNNFGGIGMAVTNQIDDASLSGVLRSAERSSYLHSRTIRKDFCIETPTLPYSRSSYIWSDSTFDRASQDNGVFVRNLTEKVEGNDLLSAGYIEMVGGSVGALEADACNLRSYRFDKYTQAQCSMTVRHPRGEGSSWSGRSGYDWKSVDATMLAEQTLAKCLSSLNPVRIEPGRYTAILEPQAVADLVKLLIYDGQFHMNRAQSESNRGIWTVGVDEGIGRIRTKLGLKVVDERITIEHDTDDPELGLIGTPGLNPVTWIRNGVLNQLNEYRPRALHESNDDLGVMERISFRMSGGDTSIDEMISTTQRGLLVTRFWGVRNVDRSSALYSGVTRDGLWLVENGVITKSVRNFRFLESPLFMLNNVEAIGPSNSVFNPNVENNKWFSYYSPHHILRAIVVPALKVKDFSFTSLVDAI